jgi:ribosomal protein S18 acetylase RimI-like enzyme
VAVIWAAGPEDAGAVAALLVQFRDHLRRDWPDAASFRAYAGDMIGDSRTEFLLGGEDRTDPRGVCQLRYRRGVWWEGEDCWLEDLFVAEDSRGSGLGRALAEAALERAGQRGCARVQLDVAEENAAARALYSGLGFGSPTLMLTLPLRPSSG